MPIRPSLLLAMAWTRSTVTSDHYFREAKKHGYVSRAAYKLMEIQRKHKVIPLGGRVLDLGCVPGAWLQVACQEVGPPDRYPRARVVGVDIQPPTVPPRYCDWRVRVLEADARAIGPRELLGAAAGGRGGWGEEEEGGWEGGGLGLERGQDKEIEEEGRGGVGGAAGARRPRGGGGGSGSAASASSSSSSSALLPFDAVLSDMLHFTSGAGAVDVARSLELAGTALHAAVGYHYDEAERLGGGPGGGGPGGGDEAVRAVAAATGVPRHSGLLKPGGAFVVKVYEGSGVDDWLRDARRYFERVVRLRVAASRSMSREFYAVGLGRKPLAKGAPPLACYLPLLMGGAAEAGGAAAAAALSPAAPEAAQQGQQGRRQAPARAGERAQRRPGGGGGGGRGAPRPPPPAEAPSSEW